MNKGEQHIPFLISSLKCCGCEACANACPRNAISMKPDDNGFMVPLVERQLCSNCGICLKSCPVQKVFDGLYPRQDLQKAYAFRHGNQNVLAHSTSGGASYAFAEYILQKGGVVFGVCLGEDLQVKHYAITELEGLLAMQGSKYVQSAIGNSYRSAKEYLDQGRLVYFTGTPCQIAGLRCYLNKDYPSLIAQDCICHGVPSPGLWQKYLNDTFGAKLPGKIVFRQKYKGTGWENGGNFGTFNGINWKLEKFQNNLWCRLFLNNWLLRSSCFNCQFKTGKFASDITCADLWGIRDILPDINDDRGMSLVLVHSKRGEELLQHIKDGNWVLSVSYDNTIAHNGMAVKSVAPPERQETFFEDMRTMRFYRAGLKYAPGETMVLKVKKKLYPLKCALKKVFGMSKSVN